MRADHCSDIIDKFCCDLIFFFYFFCKKLRIFSAIPMTDKNRITGLRIASDLAVHQICQFKKRLLSPPHFTYRDQFSLIIDMQDRFDIQHSSENRSCPGYTAATIKMVQIIYCKKMYDIFFVCFYPLCNFIYIAAFFFFILCQIYQQSLSQRS